MLGVEEVQRTDRELSMLNLVLKDNYLSSEDNREKLAKEFKVEITPELEKGVADMCNLSAGIERQGIEKGRIEGRAEGFAEGRIKTVVNTLRRYMRRQLPISADVIADIAEDNEMTIEKVRSIAKDNDILLS